MADLFEFSGSFSATPATGAPSGQPTVSAPLAETLLLQHQLSLRLDLTTNDPVSVPLTGLSAAHVVFMRATGKVRVRLTSDDGSAQAVPCDPTLNIISQSVPITALDITRVADQATTVDIFLGERA